MQKCNTCCDELRLPRVHLELRTVPSPRTRHRRQYDTRYQHNSLGVFSVNFIPGEECSGAGLPCNARVSCIEVKVWILLELSVRLIFFGDAFI